MAHLSLHSSSKPLLIRNSGTLPQLIPDQLLKLKQLTVLTVAESNKDLPYDALLEELEVSSVRELEDFFINECIYTGIVKGKLNQLRRCFEFQSFTLDLMHGHLGSMIETLEKWLTNSDNLLSLIQEKIEWANSMYLLDKHHQKGVEDRIVEVKRSLHFEKSHHKEGHDAWAYDDIFYNYDGALLPASKRLSDLF
ncbi:hypothetical protein GH714_038119 [Hevea brasiliensis]|uniref:PCI domain-containing protein n=1 Tax=Hevea brasiliensis TaxID=3981 RepID=A0A6A6MRL8_HEVBR|nr:hypothetical protein GH714_038119 [Hevea brasiliensis]